MYVSFAAEENPEVVSVSKIYPSLQLKALPYKVVFICVNAELSAGVESVGAAGVVNCLVNDQSEVSDEGYAHILQKCVLP